MINSHLANQIHRLPFHVLAAALPQLRPFDSHTEVRRDFAAWALCQRQLYPTWQDAWNAWTRVSAGRPGQIDLQVTCPDCRGRLISTRHGIPAACLTCMGRRYVRLTTPTLWQQPPDA
jgi:hypothetical protein